MTTASLSVRLTQATKSGTHTATDIFESGWLAWFVHCQRKDGVVAAM
jgi:hypothetical protein